MDVTAVRQTSRVVVRCGWCQTACTLGAGFGSSTVTPNICCKDERKGHRAGASKENVADLSSPSAALSRFNGRQLRGLVAVRHLWLGGPFPG
jgi:hypothetical protein